MPLLVGWGLLLGPAALAADGSAAVAVVLDVGDAAVSGSERTEDALVRELERRGFEASVVDGEGVLAGGGATAARLEAERRLASGDVVVLVEAEAAFYAQVAGRYRWTVTAQVTVAPRVADGEPLVRAVEVPVFLVYDHEREAEALAESSAMLARRVGAVARDFRDGER